MPNILGHTRTDTVQLQHACQRNNVIIEEATCSVTGVKMQNILVHFLAVFQCELYYRPQYELQCESTGQDGCALKLILSPIVRLALTSRF